VCGKTQRVAKDGTLVGAPVVIDTLQVSGPMLLFTAGSDTVMLKSEGIQYLVRFSANGKAAWSAVRAVSANRLESPSLGMVSQGGDAVIAWTVSGIGPEMPGCWRGRRPGSNT
jgi:hypothetical protein